MRIKKFPFLEKENRKRIKEHEEQSRGEEKANTTVGGLWVRQMEGRVMSHSLL